MLKLTTWVHYLKQHGYPKSCNKSELSLPRIATKVPKPCQEKHLHSVTPPLLNFTVSTTLLAGGISKTEAKYTLIFQIAQGEF